MGVDSVNEAEAKEKLALPQWVQRDPRISGGVSSQALRSTASWTSHDLLA